MSVWSNLPPEEIEARRVHSVEALARREREEWDRWYQEQCDRLYWTRGKCCAGCDHWSSEMGMTGNCQAAGIMSGEDVLASMGVHSATYMPPPGLPFTQAENYCGKFQDDFDWSDLDIEYLTRIGATKFGLLKEKPQTTASV